MYLLDTNILSEFVRKRPHLELINRFHATDPEDLFTTTICVNELRYGAMLREDAEEFWTKLDEQILNRVRILTFDKAAACEAGDIRASGERRGAVMSYPDSLIAAAARSADLVLVTRNRRHFESVEELRLENWFEPPGSRTPT